MPTRAVAPAPALELIAVSRRYRAGLAGCSGEIAALDRVSLRVECAERIVLVGAPGAGKTTLMLCAAGLLRPDSGVVRGSGAAYASTVERFEEIGRDASVVLLDLPAMPGNDPQRDRVARRAAALRNGGTAVVLAARTAPDLRLQGSRIVTLAGGRLAATSGQSLTLELDVGVPLQAVLVLERRLPGVRLVEGVLRVPIGPLSAEEVLSTCLSAGVRVHASRVLVEAAARFDRVAERG